MTKSSTKTPTPKLTLISLHSNSHVHHQKNGKKIKVHHLMNLHKKAQKKNKIKKPKRKRFSNGVSFVGEPFVYCGSWKHLRSHSKGVKRRKEVRVLFLLVAFPIDP